MNWDLPETVWTGLHVVLLTWLVYLSVKCRSLKLKLREQSDRIEQLKCIVCKEQPTGQQPLTFKRK